MEMKPKLAIFDLDGTLFDTGRLNYLAYQKALSELGFPLMEDAYRENCNGRHYREYLPVVAPGITDAQMEHVHEAKKRYYGSFLSEARPNVHLVACMEGLRTQGYRIAMVTTASRKNCMDILRHFEMDLAFARIWSQEDIAHVKPDPEGFFLAMNAFSAAPADTIIFEDSEDGIAAALASGASVIRVQRF